MPLPAWRAQPWSLSPAQLLAVTCLLVAPIAMAVDCPVSQWCLTHKIPGEVRKVLQIGELYSNGLVLLVIALAIHQLDAAKRRFLPHLLVAAWGAGMTANLIKMMVGRIRPCHFDFHGNVWSTFTGWFSSLTGGSSHQSFPSAHVAVAAGLTTVLSRMYPQTPWLFVLLAVLAGCQRILGVRPLRQ